MANRYTVNNCLSLFVLDTTMKSIYKDALRSPNPTLARGQALLDFVNLGKARTGDNVGNWIHAIQKGVGCNPVFVGIHIVDGAYNSGKYVKVLEWQTQGGIPQKIVTSNCDSHMSNISATQYSGTSVNNHNMNPGFDESLSKIQIILFHMKRLGNLMKAFDDVQNEHGREKVQTFDFSV